MADFYVDHGAYATALGATPTWGVPQEGDGSTKDAATSASIGSVVFASVPTSGTISVCGATVSTTGVIGAASVDAAANALATNINATTATVSTSVAINAGSTANQLRNFVYARGPSGGAPAGTCQIMMRVGSTTLNYAENSAAQIATTFSAAPTITQFAGGTSGCWGWLVQTQLLGVANSIVLWTYGILHRNGTVTKSGSSAVYTLTEMDTVWCRNGKNLVMPNQNAHLNLRQSGQTSLCLVVDTNTVWTGDDPAGVVKCARVAGTGYSGLYFNAAVSKVLSIVALKKNGFQVGLVGTATTTAGHRMITCVDQQASLRLKNCRIFNESATSTLAQMHENDAGAYGACVFENCTIEHTQALTGTQPPLMLIGSYSQDYQQDQFFENCEVYINYVGVTPPALFGGLSGSKGCRLRWIGGLIYGASTDFPLFAPGMSTSAYTARIIVDGIEGVSFPTAYFGIQTSVWNGNVSEDNRVVQVRVAAPGNPFRYEDQATICDFDPQASPAFPMLAAMQPDGTPYSIRMLWFNTTASHLARGSMAPVLGMQCVAAGFDTVTLNIFAPTALALNAMNLSIGVAYVDAGGTKRSQSATGADLVAGATWTNAGDYAGYSSRKAVIPLDYAIKVGTEVQVFFTVFGTPSTAQNEYLYIDPAFELS